MGLRSPFNRPITPEQAPFMRGLDALMERLGLSLGNTPPVGPSPPPLNEFVFGKNRPSPGVLGAGLAATDVGGDARLIPGGIDATAAKAREFARPESARTIFEQVSANPTLSRFREQEADLGALDLPAEEPAKAPGAKATQQLAPGASAKELADAASAEAAAQSPDLADKGMDQADVQTRARELASDPNALRKAILGLAASPGSVNLSSLAAFVDAQTGSKFAPAFANRETPDQRRVRTAAMLAKLEEIDQARETSQLQALASFMKSNKAKELTPGQILTNIRVLEGSAFKRATQIQDKFSDADSSLAAIDSSLQSGNQAQIRAILAQVARIVSGEGSRLTEGDIGRTHMTSLRNEVNRLIGFFTGPDTAPVDPRTLQPLKVMVHRARKTLIEKAILKTQKGSESFGGRQSAKILGLPQGALTRDFESFEKELKDRLNSLGPEPPVTAAEANRTGGLTPQEQEELDALEDELSK